MWTPGKQVCAVAADFFGPSLGFVISVKLSWPCLCRELLSKLADIVGRNMAELGQQRAAAAAGAAGKAAVYELEKKLAQLESGTVLEPYTGEDLKEILKAAEVLSTLCACPMTAL